MWRMLRDTTNGPLSLSKVIALGFACVIAADMIRNGIHGYNNIALGLDMSAAFGRAMFGKWLDRNTFKTANANTTTVDAAKVVEAIRARRDHAAGIEPT